MTVNYDRDEFRKYLQDSGAVEAVSRVFLKLYELKGNRPKSSIKFIQDRISDAFPSLTEYDKLKEDLIAMGGILSDLRTAGKLERHHIVVIDQIFSETGRPNVSGACGEVHRSITARQSQIAQGNEFKSSAKMVSKIRQLTKDTQDYDKKIEEAITTLLGNKSCNSLLQKNISVSLYQKYQKVKTKNGATFVDCICTGLDIPESMIGVYATDSDAYDEFKELFSPIIKSYHIFDTTAAIKHPPLNWGDPDKLQEIDPTNKYIVSTRIRCIRNVANYPFVPKMTKKQLTELCATIKTYFSNKWTSNDLDGDWYELNDPNMDPDTRKYLIDNRYILEFGDKFLESAGATEYWPEGRAVYINKNRTFFVWINEEDHLRFISMEVGSKIRDIYKRLKEAVEAVAGKITFQRHATLGFLSLCPTNLGNTIRASVMIKVPELVKQNKLRELANEEGLELRDGSADDTFEISNKRKLGLTEFDTIDQLCKKITKIIEKEKTL